MNDLKIIQKIFRKNNIGFSINSKKHDNKNNKYNLITLIANRDNNVVGCTDFFTNLYFNKENGNLEKIEILE